MGIRRRDCLPSRSIAVACTQSDDGSLLWERSKRPQSLFRPNPQGPQLGEPRGKTLLWPPGGKSRARPFVAVSEMTGENSGRSCASLSFAHSRVSPATSARARLKARGSLAVTARAFGNSGDQAGRWSTERGQTRPHDSIAR